MVTRWMRHGRRELGSRCDTQVAPGKDVSLQRNTVEFGRPYGAARQPALFSVWQGANQAGPRLLPMAGQRRNAAVLGKPVELVLIERKHDIAEVEKDRSGYQ
jgi:hypothetical protein